MRPRQPTGSVRHIEFFILASEELNSMVDAADFDADELLALARFDLEKERPDAALAKLKRARALNGSPIIASELGRLYARLGLQMKAKAMFEAVLAAEPKAVHDRFQLGLVYFEMQDRAKALSLWDEVLNQSPLHPPALFHSALAVAQTGEVERAHDLCLTIVDKIGSDNLFHGKARELLQKIEADPRFRKAAAERPLASTLSTTEH